MSQQYILALDQGTTSSRAILFDREGRATAVAQQEFEQIYPRPGWVEHRPEDIWSSQLNAVHVQIAERTIGQKPGTGGTTGVAYLAEGLENAKAFPDLWAVRTRL